MVLPYLDGNDVNRIIDVNIGDDSFCFIVVIVIAGINISSLLPPSLSSSDRVDNDIDSDPSPPPSACVDDDNSGQTSVAVQAQVSPPDSKDDAASDKSYNDDNNADGKRQR